MPADLLPMPGFYKNETADAGKGEGEQAEGAADASPLMVAGGVAAVAVVGAGVGVAVERIAFRSGQPDRTHPKSKPRRSAKKGAPTMSENVFSGTVSRRSFLKSRCVYCGRRCSGERRVRIAVA